MGETVRFHARRVVTVASLALAQLALCRHPIAHSAPVGAQGWHESPMPGVRGMTIGPIENALHPGRGYGTERCARALHEAARMGANWVSLTPFGRIWDLAPTGVALTFEAPFRDNRRAVKRAIDQAHAEGLRVLLIPQLWVETGGWRGELELGDDEAWQRWADGYGDFILEWARVAHEANADMFSVGVELRSWVTTTHAPSFVEVIRRARQIYPGLVTYAANWDDVEDTVILGELDVIGVNAFFPLASQPEAELDELQRGARDAARRMERLSKAWNKPLLFTEFGYTTRKDPAVRPWEWPEHLSDVVVDEVAQAEAYHSLLSAFIPNPWFAGFFVWRVYADPDDVSQEAEWGFSPRGKRAELVLRDAFGAWLAADGPRPAGAGLWRPAARGIGRY
jgi:hypothetical protein